MHIIRLRHPWQAAWRDLPAGDALKLDHADHQLRLAQYNRQFHRPNGLRKHQPVTLVVQPTDSMSPVRPFVVHSIQLNSQPLPISVATNDAQLFIHISARIESILEPFNQIEIMCGMTAGEILGDQVVTTTAARDADASSIPPPALSQWAEVRLEIDD